MTNQLDYGQKFLHIQTIIFYLTNPLLVTVEKVCLIEGKSWRYLSNQKIPSPILEMLCAHFEPIILTMIQLRHFIHTFLKCIPFITGDMVAIALGAEFLGCYWRLVLVDKKIQILFLKPKITYKFCEEL